MCFPLVDRVVLEWHCWTSSSHLNTHCLYHCHVRRKWIKTNREDRECDGAFWFVMSLFHFLPLQHGDSSTVGIRQTSSHRLVWTGSEGARSRAHCSPPPSTRPLSPLEPSWLVTMGAARPHLRRAVWAVGNFTCCHWPAPLQTSYFGAGPANCARRARGEVEL